MNTERESILALIEKRILGEREYCLGCNDAKEMHMACTRESVLMKLKFDIERGEHLRQFPVKVKV